jgi:integrase
MPKTKRGKPPKPKRWVGAIELVPGLPLIRRPYDLRHSFASLLLHERKTIAEVAEQLGDSVATAQADYVHVIEELRGVEVVSAEKLIVEARARVERKGVRKVCGELARSGSL